MPRYLDPKIDLIFQRVFGQHEDLLVDLLNALLPLDVPIVSLSYLARGQIPELPTSDKYTIVDVKCRDANDRIFVVEMQLIWRKWYDKRVLFYGAQAYVNQLPKGRDYELLQPVYALALINDYFDKESPYYYHHYKIVRQQETEKVLEGLEFIFIELPKFSRDHADSRFAMKKVHVLWLRFLKEIDEHTSSPDPQLSSYPPIAEALKLIEAASYTRDERELYEGTWDRISVARSYQGEMERAVAKGEARGEARGLANSLRLVLRTRFGNLSPEIEERLKQASLPELQSWLERALTASTLEKVFDES